MALERISADVLLGIMAILPLSSIASLALVKKAWKEFINTNEADIYHGAAAFHQFIPSRATTLDEAVAQFDFFAAELGIRGWKRYCEWCGSMIWMTNPHFLTGQVRLAIERSWTGTYPSKIMKMKQLGDCINHWEIIPGSGHTIVASESAGIFVSDGYETLWALPAVSFSPHLLQCSGLTESCILGLLWRTHLFCI